MEQKIKSPKKKVEPIIPPKEHVYLDGPKSRGYELEFAWKVFWEFIMGFRNLHFVGPCITVFGSARFKEDNKYYECAREFGKRIAGLGFTTLTGGGPGIMVRLTIDTEKLTAPWQNDLAPSINEEFPHVYGPINTDAVVEITAISAVGS